MAERRPLPNTPFTDNPVQPNRTRAIPPSVEADYHPSQDTPPPSTEQSPPTSCPTCGGPADLPWYSGPKCSDPFHDAPDQPTRIGRFPGDTEQAESFAPEKRAEDERWWIEQHVNGSRSVFGPKTPVGERVEVVPSTRLSVEADLKQRAITRAVSAESQLAEERADRDEWKSAACHARDALAEERARLVEAEEALKKADRVADWAEAELEYGAPSTRSAGILREATKNYRQARSLRNPASAASPEKEEGQ